MKTYFFHCLAILFLISIGCSPSRRDYKNASDTNTIEGYEAFLAEHPKGRWADSASMQIAFLTADEVGTAQAYRDYLTKYPVSSPSMKATQKLDSLTTMRGGCLAVMGTLPDSITLQLDSIVQLATKKDIGKLAQTLFKFIKSDSVHLASARPRIQQALDSLANASMFYFRWDEAHYTDSLVNLFESTPFLNNYSYEASICRKIKRSMFINEMILAKEQTIKQAKNRALNGFVSAFNQFVKSETWDVSEFDRMNLNSLAGAIRKRDKAIDQMLVTYKTHFSLLVEAMALSLSHPNTDVCSKNNYWEFFDEYLNLKKDSIITLTLVHDPSDFLPYKIELNNSREIIDALTTASTNEKHELIKPLAAKVLAKLQPDIAFAKTN